MPTAWGRVVTVARSERLPIRSDEDVVRVRAAVRAPAIAAALGTLDPTKVVPAARELARNTLDYGGGGDVLVELVREPRRHGVRLTFTDEGPGIPDIRQALTDRFTTGGGMGLGLGGAKRLSNEFDIVSTPGIGTRVTIARWKPA